MPQTLCTVILLIFTMSRCSLSTFIKVLIDYRPRSRGNNTFGSVRVCVCVCVCVSVRLSVGTLLFEPFDL